MNVPSDGVASKSIDWDREQFRQESGYTFAGRERAISRKSLHCIDNRNYQAIKLGYQTSKVPRSHPDIHLPLCIDNPAQRPLHGTKESPAAEAQQQVKPDLPAGHQYLLINEPPLLIKPSTRRLAPPLQHNTIHLKSTRERMVCASHKSVLALEVGNILGLGR